MKILHCFFSAALLSIASIDMADAPCDPDLQTPVAVCIANINIALDGAGMAVLDPAVVNGGSSDNCTAPEDLVFSVAPSMFDCSDVGTTTTVFLTVTDASFNTNVCYSEVLVRDLTGPVIACRANVNVVLPVSGVATMTSASLVYSAEDNCNLTYDFSPATLGCPDIGLPVDVTVNVTDAGGNSNACVSTVVVQDNQPPVIACASATTVFLGAGGVYTVDPLAVLAIADDNCDLTLIATPASVDCGDAGKSVAVQISATDSGGNTAMCSGTLEVADPKPTSCDILGPEIIECGAIGVQISAQVQGGNGPFDYHWEITKGASDGWSIVAGQGTPNVIIDAGIKKLTLVLTITDVCGKKVKCKYKATCVEPAPLVSASWVQYAPAVSNAQQYPWAETAEEILLYPNPVRDHLVLKLGARRVARVVVMDPAGKVVTAKTDIAPHTQTTLDIAALAPGLYFLMIERSDSEQVVRQFVKRQE